MKINPVRTYFPPRWKNQCDGRTTNFEYLYYGITPLQYIYAWRSINKNG